MRRNVAILLFDDVKVLDFAGPFEVFAAADELHRHTGFPTFTVAETPGTNCALHVVGRLLGADAADQTMRYLEYGRYAQPA